MRYVVVLIVTCLVLAGCATSSPNMFSGKAVVQFDQAQFFVTYLKVSQAYSVFAYQMTVACAPNPTTPACDTFKSSDAMIQKIGDEINTAIQNPNYPVDMAKVQAFVDLVLVTLMKVGVKGITAGAL